jgi:hypothetical protein
MACDALLFVWLKKGVGDSQLCTVPDGYDTYHTLDTP